VTPGSGIRNRIVPVDDESVNDASITRATARRDARRARQSSCGGTFDRLAADDGCDGLTGASDVYRGVNARDGEDWLNAWTRDGGAKMMARRSSRCSAAQCVAAYSCAFRTGKSEPRTTRFTRRWTKYSWKLEPSLVVRTRVRHGYVAQGSTRRRFERPTHPGREIDSK